MTLQKTDRDGTQTFTYTAKNSDGIVAGFVRKVRGGEIIEDREMRFDDVAGHSPASKKAWY